jgi:hypothetical protein
VINPLSRKFIAALIAQVLAFILQWNGKLDTSGNAYMLIVLGTIGAYLTSNVLAKRQRDTTSTIMTTSTTEPKNDDLKLTRFP